MKTRLVKQVTSVIFGGIILFTVVFAVRAGRQVGNWAFVPKIEKVERDLRQVEPTAAEPEVEPKQQKAQRYASVGEYFKAGNPNATTYRLGEPWIKRKSFSAKKRAIIHQENGGCCQVCGATGYLEVEHRRALMNGGGNERENLGSLCDPCHNQKTRMDKSLRRQREKLLKARK